MKKPEHFSDMVDRLVGNAILQLAEGLKFREIIRMVCNEAYRKGFERGQKQEEDY